MKERNMSKIEEITEIKNKLDEFMTLNIPVYKDEEDDGVVWFANKFVDKGYVSDDEPVELLEVDPACPLEIISYELASYLIRSDGSPDFEAHRQLRAISNGDYRVVAGEVDSFGWLTGVVITPKGRICYG